jgi:hypothetical protein
MTAHDRWPIRFAAAQHVSFTGDPGRDRTPRRGGGTRINTQGRKPTMSQLIDVFVDPAKLWLRQAERPTFLLPALVVALAAAVPPILYYLQVDPEWFADRQVQTMLAQDMSASEVEQAQAFLPGARASAWIAGITTLVMLAIVFPVMALYFVLAGKVAGHAVDFRRGLSLATWPSVPMVVGGLIVLFGVFTSSPQTPLESLQMLNVDPLFVQLPLDHDWSMLAKSFSLLNVWVWFLAALGWKTWFRTGWGQALFVAMLPGVVIFGVMALFALI